MTGGLVTLHNYQEHLVLLLPYSPEQPPPSIFFIHFDCYEAISPSLFPYAVLFNSGALLSRLSAFPTFLLQTGDTWKLLHLLYEENNFMCDREQQREN